MFQRYPRERVRQKVLIYTCWKDRASAQVGTGGSVRFADSDQDKKSVGWRGRWHTKFVKRIYSWRREFSSSLVRDFFIRSQKAVPKCVDTGPENKACLLAMLKLFNCSLNPGHKAWNPGDDLRRFPIHMPIADHALAHVVTYEGSPSIPLQRKMSISVQTPLFPPLSVLFSTCSHLS
jgi:hypothetical protein